jgi:hypothetical protein
MLLFDTRPGTCSRHGRLGGEPQLRLRAWRGGGYPGVNARSFDIAAHDVLSNAEHRPVTEVITLKKSHNVRELIHVGHQEVSLGDQVLFSDVRVQIRSGVVTETAVGHFTDAGQLAP